MPSCSAWNQVSLSRPGTASIFTPKAGIVQAWITSAPVTCTCTTLLDRHHDGGVGGEQVEVGRVAVRLEVLASAACRLSKVISFAG